MNEEKVAGLKELDSHEPLEPRPPSIADLSQSLSKILKATDTVLTGPVPPEVRIHIDHLCTAATHVARFLAGFGTETDESSGACKRSDELDRKSLRLLVVEDSDTSYAAIRSMMRRNHKVEVSRVKSVHDALRELKRKDFGAMLLDYLLPDGNGLQVLRKMKREGIDTPVVMVTGHGDEIVAARAIREGAYDYLPKPLINSDALSRSLANAVEKHAVAKRSKQENTKIAEQAVRDQLTHLYNRWYLVEVLERECTRARRCGSNLGVCMVDLDHFKRINDTYGHLAGDKVLVDVAKILLDSVRHSDVVCRYGGEEFAILLSDAKAPWFVDICERLRTSVSDHSFNWKSEWFKVTASIGLALYDPPFDLSPSTMLERADQALYEAKRGGRNRVAVSGR